MRSDPSAAEIYGRDFPAGAVVFEEGDPGSGRLREASRQIRNVLSAEEAEETPRNAP